MELLVSLHELEQRSREVLACLRRGGDVWVQRDEGVKVRLQDRMDYRIMAALAHHLDGAADHVHQHTAVMCQYMDRDISVGKAAKRLKISRAQLIARLTRLGIPVRVGPDTVEEIRADMRAMRRTLGDPDA